MSVTTAQAVTLLENVLFESSTIAQANAASWVSQSATNSSLSSVAALAVAMAASPEAEIAEQVVRYYMGALGRVPAGNEIQYYTSLVEAGLTANQIAQGSSAVAGSEWAQIAAYFAASPEFATDFGLTTAGQVNSSNEVQVIDAFYQNILGRIPNLNEIAYYQSVLNSGTSLATLVQYFATSPEYQASVDFGISTALAGYGAAVVGGTTPAALPFTPLSATLGSAALTLTGLLNSTAVSVTGTPATAGQAAQTAVTGVIGVLPVTAATGVQGVTAVTAVAPVTGQSAVTAVTDGAVTINDASSGAAGAGVIKSVTLADSGAGSVINDNGLTSLTLIGTTGTLAITNLNTTAITAHNSALALIVDGLSATANTITDTSNEISTLSVTTTTADSVLAGFADTHLTTLNVAGSNKLTLLSINNTLAALNVTGGASFSDGATTHAGGLAALGSHLTITDSSTGTFTAALDDTTQSFTGGAGADTITVSALADATKTITGGAATSNEITFEGGFYGLSSASSGKFVNFQTVGVAANVTGTIDLSVVDPTATGLEVIGTNSGITFTKAAKGASLLLDPSSGAIVTVNYADSTGASDSVKVTMSSAVASLTLQDSAGVGIGTVSIENDLGATDTNVSPAHVIGTLTDNGLATLNVTGAAGLSITTLSEASTPAASFTLNNASTDGYGVTIGTFTDTALATLAFAGVGVSTIGALNSSAASLAITNSGTTLDYVGTITDTNLTSLSLAANVSLGQVSSALTSNGLQDGSTAGVTVSGGSDNAHVTVNLTNGAASGNTDAITLGNGNNVVVDGSTAGTVNVKLGGGANLVELGGASLNTTAKYNVTFAARTGTPPNAVFIGAAGTSYNSAPDLVISGATTGDIIAFGNDTLSLGSALTATSLTGASSVANAITDLETAVSGTQHKVAYGVYGGNTYIVETNSGTLGATDTAVLEVTGSQTLTASTGYVTLGSAQGTLPTGGLSGASFTIPAGTFYNSPNGLTLGAGANIVTLTGPSAGVGQLFTSVGSSTSLIVNYQATSGTDTIAMSGSGGANASDIASLTVNDTSTGSAGVTMGAFSDSKLTSVTYNNSAALSGSILTQQALTSSTLNTISFTGGTSGKTTNSYFFTGALSASGVLTVNDSNVGTGIATMGLTLTGGPSTLALNMTSPGSLAVGTVSDNNLTAMNIAGSGTGTVTVGTVSDSTTGAFTVTDSSTSTGATTIALAGLTNTATLTVTDSATAALTDNSTYSDANLTTLTLTNTGAGALTIGFGGLTISSPVATPIVPSNIVIKGSSTGSIATGTITDVGSGALTITDTSTATGGASLPLNISGVTALTVSDSSAGALNLGNLSDNSLTSLSITNTGSATLTLGTVTVNALTTYNITLGGTGALAITSITDSVASGVTVNDTSTSSVATTLPFSSLPNAISFTVNDAATSALTITSLTANSATSLVFSNTSSALLTATVTDDAPSVAVSLHGSSTGTQAITVVDAGATALSVSDDSSSTGASTVSATLTGGPASFSVTDSAAAALTIGAIADGNLTTIALSNSGTALLTATSFTSAANGTLTGLSFGTGGGAISTSLSAAADTAALLTISDSDSGSVSLALAIGGAVGNTNTLTVQSNSGAGNLTISAAATVYLGTINLNNSGGGTTSTTLADGVTGSVAVNLTGTGAQVVSLTDNAGVMNVAQTDAPPVVNVNTALTLTHNGQSGDSITLGNGVNSVVLLDSTPNDTVNLTLGIGTNTITLTAGHTVGSNHITLAAASSANMNTTAVTADSIKNFLLDNAGTATVGDNLSVGTTTILSTTAALTAAHWTVSAGMMTNTNATVLNFIAAVQSVSSAGVAGFVDNSGNSWVAYTDGSQHVGVIELVGVTVAGFETALTTTSYVHLS